MRRDPDSSRFGASMTLDGLAAARTRTGDQANICFGDDGYSMQKHCVASAVWGEFASEHVEGGLRVRVLEHWWIPGPNAAGSELLDLVAGLLLFDLLFDAIYFRRRANIRSLSHRTDFPVQRQTGRISDAQIAKLQHLLKQHFGLDYSAEEAQDAGRAILRFVGLKLYQQLEKDRTEGRG